MITRSQRARGFDGGRAASTRRGRTSAAARRWGSCAAVAAATLGAASTARADLPADSVEFPFYGRMGVGWTPSGQVIAGRYMNLGRHWAIGGRLEEGDYLEPGIRYHIKKAEKPTDTSVDLLFELEVWSYYGSIISDLANTDIKDIAIVPLQAYVEAKNAFGVDGLSVWLGSRLYRKKDVHICDYFYFNQVNGQGIGGKYGGLELAVLTRTGGGDTLLPGGHDFYNYNFATDPSTPDVVKRQRTYVDAQYAIPFGPRTSFVQGLAEFHVVPRSQDGSRESPGAVNPPDTGWVAGAKVHLDLGRESFNDASIRYGTGIANGAESGGLTYQTFGRPGPDGTYGGAYGIEFVEHFMVDLAPIVQINGYFTAHESRGASDYRPTAAGDPEYNRTADYSFGARPTFFLTDQLHLITEATYQARKDGQRPMGTAVKLSVAPTLVPTGERSSWTRPQLRLIYTAGFYNDAAVDQLMSPYLKTVGATRVAQFLGARTEWWF